MNARTARPPDGPPSLVRHGVTPTADLVFRALARGGAQTTGALARDLGIAIPRVRDCLATLRDHGFVAEPVGRAGGQTWQVVGTARLNETLARRDAPPERPSLPPLDDRLRRVALGSGVNHLTSRAAARERMARLVSLVRHEHLAINPEPVFDESAKTAAAAMDSALHDRGVAVRVVGTQVADANLLTPYGGATRPEGAAYRVGVDLPLKLIVVDRSVAIVPVDPHNFERGYLEIHHPQMVASLIETFERTWQRTASAPSTPLSPFGLSGREAAVLALLMRGATDTTVARQLGISARTVTGIVRGLMDRWEVSNRFQLGLALGAAGLADPTLLKEIS